MMSYTKLLKECRLCPRNCGVDRTQGKGFCGEGADIRIARASLHLWEEPCISGKNGSGTVFFSGCNLKCCFCQNYEISHQAKGFEISTKELADIMLKLQEKGAHNINLVNPTHFVPQILDSIEMAGDKLKLPIIYNCGGYEKVEALNLLKGKIRIFLPDLKYYDNDIANKYSSAADYFEKAIASIKAMVEIVGKPKFEDGLITSGVIVRHLILPNHRQDSKLLIQKLAENFKTDEILISLMGQYTPVYNARKYKEINRRLSTFEYKDVEKALENSGFDGFVQQLSSASEDFIPQFYGDKSQFFSEFK